MSTVALRRLKFTRALVNAEIPFEKKVELAFRQVIPGYNKLEITEWAVRLHNCNSCKPLQRFILDNYPELMQLKAGDNKEFDLMLKFDIRLL